MSAAGRLVLVDPRAWPVVVACEGEDGPRAALGELVSKRGEYWGMAQKLQRMGERGLVVVVAPGGAGIEKPAPIEVPFEPVLLDESDPRVADLAAAGDGRIVSEPAVVPKQRSTVSRWLMRLGLGGVVFWNIVLNLSLNSGLNRRWWMWALNGGILLAVLVGGWVVSKVRRDAWMCVPAGIVAVRRALFSTKNRLLLFTTADSNVVVTAGPGRSWYAEAVSARGRSKAILTELELAALLAAWRSPLSPPSEEQLRSLG